MRSGLHYSLLGILLAVSGGIATTVESTDSGTLRLEEWIQTALPCHPEVREADMEVLYRASRRGHPGNWEDPELRLGQANRDDRGDRTEVRLRVPLPNPWTAAARRNQLEAREMLAANGRTTALVTACSELKEVFLETLYRQEKFKILEEISSIFQRRAAQADLLLKAGQSTEGETLRWKGQLAESLIRKARARYRLESMKADMNALSGTARIRRVNLDTSSFSDEELLLPLPDLETLQRHALENSPLLDKLQIEQHLDRFDIAESRSRSIPAPEYIQGTWTRDPEADRDDFEISIQFPLPVFSLFRERALAIARSERSDTFSQLQRELIVQSLKKAWRKAQASRQQLVEMNTVATELITMTDDFLHENKGAESNETIRILETRLEASSELLEARFIHARCLLDLQALLGAQDPTLILQELIP